MPNNNTAKCKRWSSKPAMWCADRKRLSNGNEGGKKKKEKAAHAHVRTAVLVRTHGAALAQVEERGLSLIAGFEAQIFRNCFRWRWAALHHSRLMSVWVNDRLSSSARHVNVIQRPLPGFYSPEGHSLRVQKIVRPRGLRRLWRSTNKKECQVVGGALERALRALRWRGFIVWGPRPENWLSIRIHNNAMSIKMHHNRPKNA